MGIFKSKGTSLLLFSIIAAGFCLRVYNLGGLGFHGDEDVTSLAIKGILEHGYPLLPSGMVYLRSAPLLYLTAMIVKLFGFSEVTLRIPSVLFSTATILLAFLFTTRLFGRRVGLAVATVIAFSPWEIEVARQARMYSAFSFCYLLTLFSFYRHYVEDKGKNKYITTVLAIITCMIHELGFTLAFLFLFPLLFKRAQTTKRVYLIFNFLVILALSQIWVQSVPYYLRLPLQIHQDPLPVLQTTPGLSSPAVANPETMTSVAVDREGGLPVVRKFLKPFHLPSFELLVRLYQNAFPAFIFLTLMTLGIGLLFVSRFLKHGIDTDNLILLLLIVAIYGHQFSVGLVLLLFFCFRTHEGLVVLRSRKVLGLGLALGLAFALWLIYGLTLEPINDYVLSGQSSQLRQTMKALINFPRLFIRAFFEEMPVLTLLAGLGFLWCFHTGSRNRSEKEPVFVLYAFAAPLLFHGIMKSVLAVRYNFQLNVLFIILVVLALTRWCEVTEALLGNGVARFSSRGRTTITGCLLLALVALDLNPVKSGLLVTQNYQQESAGHKFFGDFFDLAHYPDHKTTAAHVKKNLQDRDVVIAMDWLAQYNYIGKTDYWIRTAGYERQTYLHRGRLRDLYTGAFLIADLNHLKSVLSKRRGQRIWIISSSLEVRNLNKVTEDIVSFLESLSEYVVYVGKDGKSKVYLLEGDWSKDAVNPLDFGASNRKGITLRLP